MVLFACNVSCYPLTLFMKFKITYWGYLFQVLLYSFSTILSNRSLYKFLEPDVCNFVMTFQGFELWHSVMQPPQSFLSTMEDYVKDAPREASNRTLYLKDVPVSDTTVSIKWWDSSDWCYWSGTVSDAFWNIEIGGWGAACTTNPAHSTNWC
jgi:hypothetical protein